MERLRSHLPTLRRKQVIAIGKGSLAYVLAFVLIFLRSFNRLNDYPITLTSMILVTIAGAPGKTVGGCLDGGILGAAGVGIGSVFFIVLAKLGHSQVAQGFVFFIICYAFALVKNLSFRYFGFALLGIIMSFSGIYTSILLGGEFSPKYLVAYLESYAWGFAIVLGVNFLIFPCTSERELREVLSSSLDHISTFSHLIAKTYILDISDEEKVVRDELNQSIRADFAFLSQRLAETSLEINWTRWSVADYSIMVGKIRQMQQGLITSYSSLISMEHYEPEALALIKNLLNETGTGRAFAKLRQTDALCFDDIIAELAVGKTNFHAPAPGSVSWDDFRDLPQDEDIESAEGRPRTRSPSVSPTYAEVQSRLTKVSSRLRKEVDERAATPVGSRRGSLREEEAEKPQGPLGKETSREGSTAVPSLLSHGGNQRIENPAAMQPLDRVAFLRECWTNFDREQNKAITDLLARGLANDTGLLVNQAGPSLQNLYEQPTPTWTSARQSITTRATKRPVLQSEGRSTTTAGSSSSDSDKIEDSSEGDVCGTAVMRVFSFLFGMGQVVKELGELHDYIVPKDNGVKRTKSLHLHMFERIPKASSPVDPISLPQALAMLQNRVYVPTKVSFWQQTAKFERLARSDLSMTAFKTACAVSVFSVFILAPSLQSFFVQYGLTGGLITIVVAISPFLGQSILTFLLQILGTGFGSLFGMIILLIFKQQGGYYWHPVGLSFLLVLYSLPLCWVIYTRPQFFAGALLALNSTGILVVTEWTYREVEGSIRPTFDSAPLRASKALVAMCLALVIAAFFMVFVLRTPARRQLRIQLSQLTFALASYNILFSAVGEAIVPLSHDPHRVPPPPEAIAAVRQELIRRETQCQGALLALMPLLKFGAAEPGFGVEFQAATYSRIIRTHQLILDRLRESRTATGGEGFSEDIQANFSRKLSPYRRQAKRFSRALFYLCATSLSTKMPLPHELPSMVSTARSIMHDALVLSGRLTQTEEGREILKTTSFVRYWFYLVSYTGVSYQLEQMEADLRILFGEVEDAILS